MITILAVLAIAAGALGLILSAAYLARVRRVRRELARLDVLAREHMTARAIASIEHAGETTGPPPLPDRLRHGRDTLRIIAQRRPRP